MSHIMDFWKHFRPKSDTDSDQVLHSIVERLIEY